MDARTVIDEIMEDAKKGIPIVTVSARFHNGVVIMVLDACNILRDDFGLETVALSGGVWQNMLLFEKVVQYLEKDKFQVIFHRQVPTNDGGLALGQVVTARSKISVR